jgi:zinc finger protein
MSFECEHCGFQNNEIQSGGKVGDKGIRISLNAEDLEDLNRTLVKSDVTCIKIPELDFEIPSNSQKGGMMKILFTAHTMYDYQYS